MVRSSPSTLLNRLEKVQDDYSASSATTKLELLTQLERRRLSNAQQVYRLHEALSFLYAYPDNRRTRSQVGRMLKSFSQRSDLKRFADELADTGIEGSATNYSFCWTTALWLATNWPKSLTIDWDEFENEGKLWSVLYALLPFTESLALDEADLDTRSLVDLLKKENESDATFLIRSFARSLGHADTREIVYEDLDLPCILSPGPSTPSRTDARYKPSPVVYQSGPLDRRRPDLKKAILEPPLAVRPVDAVEGRALIDMARSAMVARSRDLYAFEYGDENDVRLFDFEDGLQFAAIGLQPAYRLMLESVYAFLTLKNGIPIGYVLTRSYFNSSEVAYNVFETYRGGEAARVYGQVLSMTHRLFGADVFTAEPYQLGHDNEEGLASGAWWFYYKLGFRPLDPHIKRLVRKELARMRRNPEYRSSEPTLNELSAKNMFFFLGKTRRDIRGVIPLDKIAVAVSRYLGQRFGSDRDVAMETCEREAARVLGLRSFRGYSADERMAFRRWSPLILALPGVSRWSKDDKRALSRVARAKGGHRESEYLQLFDSHEKLRQALLQLARQPS